MGKLEISVLRFIYVLLFWDLVARLRLWNNVLMDILQCFQHILEMRTDRRAVESVCEYLLRVDGGKFCLGIKP